MLSKWSETLERPSCMWISGMFNPTAYLTSILQATGRNTGWALDKMAIETHVTMDGKGNIGDADSSIGRSLDIAKAAIQEGSLAS